MADRTPSLASARNYGTPSHERRGKSVGPMQRGFTLIELLVVIGVIAVLVSVLLPALTKARESAVRVECASQLRQIMIGTLLYAHDHKGVLPSRASQSYGYPHETHRTSNGRYNLNTSFIVPYLNDRNKIMFCPAQLHAVSPLSNPGAFDDRFCSYQYHVYPKNIYWKVPWVDLTRIRNIKGNPPIWSCLTQTKNGLATALHGKRSGNPAVKPKGLNSAFSDGSAHWVPFAEAEPFWGYGTELDYWPKYREP